MREPQRQAAYRRLRFRFTKLRIASLRGVVQHRASISRDYTAGELKAQCLRRHQGGSATKLKLRSVWLPDPQGAFGAPARTRSACSSSLEIICYLSRPASAMMPLANRRPSPGAAAMQIATIPPDNCSALPRPFAFPGPLSACTSRAVLRGGFISRRT